MNRRSFLHCSAAFATYPLLPLASAHAEEPAPLLLLEAREADIALLGADGPMTTVWSFNGMVPGPEIRVPAGDKVKARLINRLPQPMAIRWHGIDAVGGEEASADLIVPSDVAPGQSFDYSLMPARPGTYWYYSGHRHDSRFKKGLYGAIIVEGDGLADCRDIALMLDEWPLDSSGALLAAPAAAEGVEPVETGQAHQITVNGLAHPTIPLRAGEAVRLRLINAAGARPFAITLPGLECSALALDGVPLSSPRLVRSDLTIAPGQRVDLFATVPASPGTSLELRAEGGDPSLPVAVFPIQKSDGPWRVGRDSLDAPAMPEPSLDDPLEVGLTLRTDGLSVAERNRPGGEDPADEGAVSAFSGAVAAADLPLFRVPHGRTVVLNLVNESLKTHVFHVYGFHFKVLEGGSSLEEGAWRDTLMIPPMGLARIAFQAEKRGNWLLGSHILEQDAGLDEGWFRVG